MCSLSSPLLLTSATTSSSSTPNKHRPPLNFSSSPSPPPSRPIAAFSSSSSTSPMDSSRTLKDAPGNLEIDGNGERIAAKRVIIKNSHGESLVGLLQESDSKDLVILCHGFRSSKESRTISNVSESLVKGGISIFRFDFSGNGESEGTFQYGNYLKEVADLRAVVQHFLQQECHVRAIVGHSKGGDVVLLYASMYNDIAKVVNISGRFDMKRGIHSRLGEDFLQRIKENGYVDVKKKNGDFDYCVSEESLMERLNTNMHDACLSIGKNCSVLTVHGSEDEIIPVVDAHEFAKLIPNHNLCIIEGADHRYSCHSTDLALALLEFL